jgi:hypothetical protein
MKHGITVNGSFDLPRFARGLATEELHWTFTGESNTNVFEPTDHQQGRTNCFPAPAHPCARANHERQIETRTADLEKS